MNIPLSWLSEYVKLPKSEKELTDKLTLIGHMLDKRTEVKGEVVIDLELRGNRSDLFGMIGIARDISAAWNTPLKTPPTKPLPKTDKASSLVSVQATDLVERFTGFTLSVSVTASPAWLVKRLEAYGIPSINNVVDITNFVMIETGEPMHAYDLAKLTGGKLIVRRAKHGEKMKTLQGTTLTFTKEDLVIADEKQPQGTAIIGSQTSGVTETTTTILLEAAVYHQANVRRTARRLGVRTEAGNRHEKLLDPNCVIPALERAYFLLTQLAHAKPIGHIADAYIKPRKTKILDVPLGDIKRLTGVEVPLLVAEDYLKRLGFVITSKKSSIWSMTVPTFRTDIEGSADVVEEIIRLYGYEKIPSKTLTGTLPEPQTYPMVKLIEVVRDQLIQLQQNEVITSPILANDQVSLYQKNESFTPVVTLVNAPDAAIATLRQTLLPNLVEYAKRSIGFRQKRIALFELGKTYTKNKTGYTETDTLGLILFGAAQIDSWNQQERALTLYDLKGVIDGLLMNLGLTPVMRQEAAHPSMDPTIQGSIMVGKIKLGSFGALHPAISATIGMTEQLFVAELSLHAIASADKAQPQPYMIAPSYPPILEDITFVVQPDTQVGTLIEMLAKVDKKISSINLVSVYENSRTIRITYSDPNRTLTNDDVTPIRQRLIALTLEKFNISVKN